MAQLVSAGSLYLQGCGFKSRYRYYFLVCSIEIHEEINNNGYSEIINNKGV